MESPLLPVAQIPLSVSIEAVCKGFSREMNLAVYEIEHCYLLSCFRFQGRHYHFVTECSGEYAVRDIIATIIRNPHILTDHICGLWDKLDDANRQIYNVENLRKGTN